MRSRYPGLKAVLAATLFSLAATPVFAQIRSIDPDTAIDADLVPGAPASKAAETDTTVAPATPPAPPAADAPSARYEPESSMPTDSTATAGTEAAPTTGRPSAETSVVTGPTYKRDDLIGAAEGVFGKGAEGLAGILEKILKDQGEPNAYIAGREASGAFVVGLRYGSGTLHHKVEGERPAYWTGPSLGFDVGGNASKTFVLVYNLYDSQELYKRFPAGEGSAYFVGGFTASYLRSGDVVLIPIRLGVGYRLGVSAGYMKFSEKQKWMPF